MSIDITLPEWEIFTIGVYAEILCLLSDPAKFVSDYMYIKNVDAYQLSFSSKKQVIKKGTAKKPLTNLCSMNSTCEYRGYTKGVFPSENPVFNNSHDSISNSKK